MEKKQAEKERIESEGRVATTKERIEKEAEALRLQ
jgi:hypothetical protein